LIDFKYRNHPTYLKALKQSIENPNDEKMKQILNEESDKL
jgi:hypothetical protein